MFDCHLSQNVAAARNTQRIRTPVYNLIRLTPDATVGARRWPLGNA